MGSKLIPQVYANNAHARCAIHSRDTAIRICSVPQLIHKNLFVKISSWNTVMSLAEYFCLQILVRIFQIWPYIIIL
jgi:hypothetical protein